MKQPKRATKAEKQSAVEVPPDVPISFESPDSSSIVGASYDADTQKMIVIFKRQSSTSTYLYEGVPAYRWADFTKAESKGKFFGTFIRPLYTGRAHDGVRT